MPTAVISTTYDPKYLWYLPITTWVWNKMGFKVVCFMPYGHTDGDEYMGNLVVDTLVKEGLNGVRHYFDCPKHKEATYSQCSRLYASAVDLPEDETLVISDIDMLVLNTDYFLPAADGIIDIYGADLVPPNQYPMCYGVANVGTWRKLIGEGTPQQHLDRLLGHIECENMRGNYWASDQENLYNLIHSNDEVDYRLHNRAKPGTQFATQRLDRDDSFILDRLSPDIWDYHMNRPGYEPQNFEKIMAILSYYFPHEDLSWVEFYNKSFVNLLNDLK